MQASIARRALAQWQMFSRGHATKADGHYGSCCAACMPTYDSAAGIGLKQCMPIVGFMAVFMGVALVINPLNNGQQERYLASCGELKQ